MEIRPNLKNNHIFAFEKNIDVMITKTDIQNVISQQMRIKHFTLIFTLFLLLLQISASAQGEWKWERIVPCDTVALNHNVASVRSFYSVEEKEQVNLYFYKNQSGNAVLDYCVGSLNPKTSFVVANTFSNIIVENKSNALVQFGTEPFFYRINNSSFILDTLQLKMRQENNEFFTINTSPYFYYIPVEKDSGILFCESFLISESNYKLNTFSRKNAFSRPIYTEFSIGKNTVSQRDGIGRFPNTHLDEDSVYYNYWYWVAPNKNLELATMFWFIDSIYVIDTKTGKQNSYFFKSKYQQHINHTIDPNNYFDYTYLSKVGCESTSYMYLKYDSYRNCYYVVVSRAMAAENEDGTRNSSADKPWSLIVLNEHFKQIAEIDMPDQFSKHEIMIVPKGFAIKDLSLSTATESIFVICKIS